MSAPNRAAKFVTGDLWRHVTVMTLSASIGLLSIFAVDLVDLYFISLLGETEMAAAVGFAGTLLFFITSISIGISIALGALMGRRLGAGEAQSAKEIGTDALWIAGLISLILSVGFFVFAPQLTDLLSAEGEARAYSIRYIQVLAPTTPALVLGMACSNILRAHGDARRAMNVTLTVGLVNAVLDPLFIFGFGWGFDGAAIASGCARVAMLFAAVIPVIRLYGGFAPFDAARLRINLKPIFGIAGPAMLTNIATPIGAVITTRAIAPYGAEVVAAYSVMGRLTPMAFGLIFALSGAIGPILAQNFGAKRFDRVQEAMTKALLFTAGYVALASLCLYLTSDMTAAAFGLSPQGTALLALFCGPLAPLFVFNGAIFVSNAAFNNLNRPLWSTAVNWARNTLGVAPFVWIGAHLGGAEGVLIGQALGGGVFGVAAVFGAYWLTGAYKSGALHHTGKLADPLMRPRPFWPFSSPRG